MTPPNSRKPQILPVADIQVEERLRPANPTAVNSIAASILEDGEIEKPLTVRRVKGGYRLIDGLHRLTAAIKVGLEDVPVKVRECTNDEALRWEVSLNLAAAPMTPLDAAVFLAAHKRLYELDNPEAKRAFKANQARRGECTDIMSVRSFAASAAETFGKGERHIRRLISVGTNLSKEEIALLRQAPNKVQFTDLEQIAKCGEADDRSAICQALGDGQAKSAKEVLDRKKASGAAVKSGPDAQAGKIGDAFARASKAARLQFVRVHRSALEELLAEAQEQAAPGEVVPFSSKREAAQ